MAQTDRLNQRSETGSPAATSGWQAYFVLPETFMTGEKKGGNLTVRRFETKILISGFSCNMERSNALAFLCGKDSGGTE